MIGSKYNVGRFDATWQRQMELRTYKPPSKKIPTIASFLAGLICSFHRHGIGNSSTVTSVKMLSAVRLCVKAY